MKSFKTMLMVVALAAGIGGAFAFKIHSMPKALDPIYDWTLVGGGGAFTGTVAQAQTHYNCTGSMIVCANGVLDPNSPPGNQNATVSHN